MTRKKVAGAISVAGIFVVALAATVATLARGDDSEKQKQSLEEMEKRWLASEDDPEALEKIWRRILFTRCRLVS